MKPTLIHRWKNGKKPLIGAKSMDMCEYWAIKFGNFAKGRSFHKSEGLSQIRNTSQMEINDRYACF